MNSDHADVAFREACHAEACGMTPVLDELSCFVQDGVKLTKEAKNAPADTDT